MLNRHKWLMPVAAISTLLIVISLALGIIGGDKKIKPGTTPTNAQLLPNESKLFKLERLGLSDVQAWQGTVQSRSLAKITPKLSTRILDITVHPGDRVKKNDILARLDDRDSRAAYDAAHSALLAVQAQAHQTDAEEKRMIDLYEKQAATRQNYDAVIAQAKAQRALVHQAESQAQQSKVMLGENVLLAPFDGVIGERLQEPGEMAMPNRPVVTLLKPDDLRLEVSIASLCASGVKLGEKMSVRIDAAGAPMNLEGVVDEISPEIDAQTRSRLFKLSLPKTPGLQHGQFAWLALGCQGEQQALLIPAAAVIHYGQLQAVKVVEGQQWTIRHIRTGKPYGDKLEVLSGLREGETIWLEDGLKP